MTRQLTKAGQLEVGQHVEYIGRRFDFPTKTSGRFVVQGEITEFARHSEDKNTVWIGIWSAGVMHVARATFHPLGKLRFQDGESIRVLHEAPRQQEIATC